MQRTGAALVGIASCLVVAVIVAVAAFFASEWIRLPGAPAPDRLGLVALQCGIRHDR